MCNGANLAFTREAYLNNSVNLHFEVPSGDDVFLLHSIKAREQSEIKWLESTDSLVTSAHAMTLLSFLKQRRRWISKYKYYKDYNTILLGIVTFVTILIQLIYTALALAAKEFIPVFIAIIIIKSVPDFLILMNTTKRYGRKKLMRWFALSQLIYPFYVAGVILYSLFSVERKRSNYPFPKET